MTQACDRKHSRSRTNDSDYQLLCEQSQDEDGCWFQTELFCLLVYHWCGNTTLLQLSSPYGRQFAGTLITDAAVGDLTAFVELKDLRLGDRLSAQALKGFRARMPNCKVAL